MHHPFVTTINVEQQNRFTILILRRKQIHQLISMNWFSDLGFSALITMPKINIHKLNKFWKVNLILRSLAKYITKVVIDTTKVNNQKLGNINIISGNHNHNEQFDHRKGTSLEWMNTQSEPMINKFLQKLFSQTRLTWLNRSTLLISMPRWPISCLTNLHSISFNKTVMTPPTTTFFVDIYKTGFADSYFQ